jgi:hypothetical protein
MNLGLGIFLSSLFLGSVALFIATKDRWNWKKLALWPVGILAALCVAFYAYSLIEDRPKAEQAFWDIPLNASKSDVKFIKGEASEKEDDVWRYITRDQSGNWSTAYYVHFEEDTVWCIAFYANEFSRWAANIQGINIGDKIDVVRRKFGEPSHVSVSDDGLKRLYTYSLYNIVFELEKNEVVGLGIAKRAPRFVPDGKSHRGRDSKNK